MAQARRILAALAVAIAWTTVALVAVGNPSFPREPQLENAVELTGVFEILWGDPQPGSGLPDRSIYTLTRDGAPTVELQLAEDVAAKAGGVLALNGKRVTAKGTLIAREDVVATPPPVLRVSSLALDAAHPPGTLDVEPSVSGSQPWVTILCKFSDHTEEPKTLAYAQGMYSSSYPGLDHYWRQASFGIVNVTGSDATGWYTLPNPRSYYVYDRNGDGKPELDFTRAANDCTGVADPYVYFPSFVGINMFFNYDLDGFSWGGGVSLSRDGVSRVWHATWEAPWGYKDITVMPHEMGHGFGLPHSSGGYGQTYDNPWDVMSDTWTNCERLRDPVYGCLGQHISAYHKDRLGWLGAGQKYTVSVGTGAVLALENVAQTASANQYQMAIVPINGTARFYTVEARKRVGYDVKLAGEAVIIHEVDPSRSIPAHVVDADGNGNNNDAGAMWTPGETFMDPGASIKIEVNQATATGFVVTIANAALAAPAITSATSMVFYVGKSSTFAVTTTGWPLPTIWKSGVLPSGVAFVSNGNGTATLSGTPAAGSAGIYPLTLTASNGVGSAATQNFTLIVIDNDRCASPAIVTPLAYSLTQDTTSATTETSDPTPGAGNGSRLKSVWYRFTATHTGTARVDTLGSSYDTILSAYRGSCGAFTPLTANDNASGTLQSQLFLSVVEGTDYYFMVTASLGDGGTLKFHLAYDWGRDSDDERDFSEDGTPDLVWRNRVTGELVFWLMDGITRGAVTTIAGPSDRNWQVVATADFNADGQADLVLRHALTGQNQVWFMTGTSHSGSSSLPDVANSNWRIIAAADFNGDGNPDLLWRNLGNGDVVVWYMNGVSYAGYALVSSIADINWQVAAVDDMNADGKPDLIWRNKTTGEDLVWFMDGATYAGFAWLTTQSNLQWVIVGTTDANGDGQPDIVWRNEVTGENKVVYMNGTSETGSAALPSMNDPECEESAPSAPGTHVGPSDFNEDGWPDILWGKPETGETQIWYMVGALRMATASAGTESDLDWHPVGVADFNRDGLPDVVWRNARTGANKIRLMVGARYAGESTLPTIPNADWHVVGVGDFNQDGHPDLAWRNYSNGQNIIWFLYNGEYAGWTAPPTITDTNWKIVAVGDFNGDRWPDLFWRNETTGVNIAWFLVNGVYAGWGQPPTIADITWQIVGAGDYNADGKADLLWRNASDGRNLLWYLRDGSYVGFDWLPSLGVEWKTGAGQ